MKRYGLLLLACFLFNYGWGQSNLGIKFFGLSMHPGGEADNAFLMPRRLDSRAVFVVNLGGMVSYERFIHRRGVSIKAVQALYSDCAARLGGFTHLGLRGRILHTSRHTLSGGIGPTLVFRRNWQHLEGYVNPSRFKGGEDEAFQYLFLWYGGEFEYACTVTDKLDITATFIPGYPDLMSLSFGVKYNW